MWKPACNFRTFSAELKSSINEPRGNKWKHSDIAEEVIEKSWNFTSGPQWEPSHCLSHHFFHDLSSVCFSPSSRTPYPNLLTSDATYLIAVTDHNISPSISLPRPSARALLTRVGLHGNCVQAHGCLDAGFVCWGESLMSEGISLLTSTEMQLTPQ